MTFDETLDEMRGVNRFKSWFNQAEVARLIGEPVEQVVEYCRIGWLEARWVDGKDGSRQWYVYVWEAYRWLNEGPRETMGFEQAMGLMRLGRCVRRAGWNACCLELFDWEGDGEEFAQLFYEIDMPVQEWGMDKDIRPYELTDEDRAATDWIEHFLL